MINLGFFNRSLFCTHTHTSWKALVPVAIVSSPVMLKSSIVAVVSLGAENMDQVKDCDGQP